MLRTVKTNRKVCLPGYRPGVGPLDKMVWPVALPGALLRPLALPTMKLDDTKRLLAQDWERSEPMELLAGVLAAAVELLSIDGNDFTWSSWHDADDAVAEVGSLLARVQNGSLPARVEVAILFAPTGPIQEVSLSSGWSDVFLQVAERYDYAERQLWG